MRSRIAFVLEGIPESGFRSRLADCSDGRSDRACPMSPRGDNPGFRSRSFIVRNGVSALATASAGANRRRRRYQLLCRHVATISKPRFFV